MKRFYFYSAMATLLAMTALVFTIYKVHSFTRGKGAL